VLMVPRARVEPARPFGQRILNPQPQYGPNRKTSFEVDDWAAVAINTNTIVVIDSVSL
jgi:hypothetical protein